VESGREEGREVGRERGKREKEEGRIDTKSKLKIMTRDFSACVCV